MTDLTPGTPLTQETRGRLCDGDWLHETFLGGRTYQWAHGMDIAAYRLPHTIWLGRHDPTLGEGGWIAGEPPAGVDADIKTWLAWRPSTPAAVPDQDGLRNSKVAEDYNRRATTPAPSDREAAPGEVEWLRVDSGRQTLLYTLRQDGWRKGRPVMVNDVTVRIEADPGSETDIAPTVARILAALSAQPVDREAVDLAVRRFFIDETGFLPSPDGPDAAASYGGNWISLPIGRLTNAILALLNPAQAEGRTTPTQPEGEALDVAIAALEPVALLASDETVGFPGVNMNDPIGKWLTVAQLHNAAEALSKLRQVKIND